MRAWLQGGGPRGLYAIIDPAQCRGRDATHVAEAVLAGGCAVLQLRAKHGTDDELLPLAERLQARCRAAGVPFVVNDRPQLARSLGADGLHLGQRDTPLERARAQVGSLPIGLSTHGLPQALNAQRRGADLIGFGPVFATRTKHDPDPVVGLAALRTACERIPIPVVAIGGIHPGNIGAIAATGARLAAVISAVCAADDPEAAARALHRALT